MGMGLHRRIATAVIGAAVLCATGTFTAGSAHAEGDLVSAPTCGDSPSSWANRWAVYSGLRFREGDAALGFQTELTIRKEWDNQSQKFVLTVAAVEANWAWDRANAVDSTFYDKAELKPNTVSNDGTYSADTVGHYKAFGEHTTTATFTITPQCAADGSVDSLSVRHDSSPSPSTWTAELTRNNVATV